MNEQQRKAMELALEAYLCREMPAGTIIGDPKWWVPKIANAIKKALAQPEQEPVGMVKDLFTNAAWDKLDVLGSTKVYLSTPQPPQRKPLTHEQRFDLLTKFEPHKTKWEAPAILIDMVEAAHGIKE